MCSCQNGGRVITTSQAEQLAAAARQRVEAAAEAARNATSASNALQNAGGSDSLR